MPVKTDVAAEEARRIRGDHALVGKLAERLGALVGRVELQHRVGPELPAVEHRANVVVHPLVADVDEALDIVAILADDLIAEAEDVEGHLGSSSSRPRAVALFATPRRARRSRSPRMISSKAA